MVGKGDGATAVWEGHEFRVAVLSAEGSGAEKKSVNVLKPDTWGTYDSVQSNGFAGIDIDIHAENVGGRNVGAAVDEVAGDV